MSNDYHQASLYAPSTQQEGAEFKNAAPNHTHFRDPLGPRGRTPTHVTMNSISLPAQQVGSGQSVRSQSSAATTRTALLNGPPMERRPSLTQNPYRQPPKNHGPFQHSRHTSFVNSPATSPLSPYPGINTANGTAGPEFSTVHQHGTPELRPSDSPSSTSGSLLSATSQLTENQEPPDANNVGSNPRKQERTGVVRARRAHSHQRSHSKHQSEPKTAYEHSLHHLFNSVRKTLSILLLSLMFQTVYFTSRL